jgi:hypothetical protein
MIALSSLALSLALAPAQAAPAFRPLHADHAEASSYLKSNWNKYEENYHPTYVLDGDPKTAWVEGKDGNGAGESITLPLSTLTSARALKLSIKNGYQKSQKLLEANGAPHKVTLIVRDADGNESARAQAVLERKMGAQDVVVDVGGKGVASVTVVVDDVTAGRVYQDTCISDIAVFVDSDVPHNAKAEEAKRAVAAAWRKERIARAKFFAKLPPTFPFSSTTFFADAAEPRPRTPPLANDDTLKRGLEAIIDAKHPMLSIFTDSERAVIADLTRLSRQTTGAKRVEFTKTRSPLPDGLEYVIDGIGAFVLRDQVVFADAVAPKLDDVRALVPGPYANARVSDAIVEGDLVYLRSRAEVGERVPATRNAQWLLRYQGDRLALVVSVQRTQWHYGDEDAGIVGDAADSRVEDAVEFTSFVRNAKGDIERVQIDTFTLDCRNTCSWAAWSQAYAAVPDGAAAAP